MVITRDYGEGRTGQMFFKAINLQGLVNKFQRANAQDNELDNNIVLQSSGLLTD